MLTPDLRGLSTAGKIVDAVRQDVLVQQRTNSSEIRVANGLAGTAEDWRIDPDLPFEAGRALFLEVFQTRQKFKAQQMAEGKPDLALPVGVQ